MNILKASKVMDRLDAMIENAINGKPIESGFDESKMAALETKLSRYLTMTQTSRQKLETEKSRVHGLVSDISHQTKTPIANLVLYAQLLEEANLQSENKFLVEAIAQQADKLKFLIGALLKTSRLEAGIVTVTPTVQPVQALLDSSVLQMAAMAKEKQITITLTPTTANAAFDLKWSTEMLTNLLENAIKYSEAGGNVAIATTQFEMFCRIDVKDKGMGISEDEHHLIFGRFYRSPKVAALDGVGIGLFLAREIVQKQGGYIKVASKPDHGSCFSIYIPTQI